jgi:hypothetical protein
MMIAGPAVNRFRKRAYVVRTVTFFPFTNLLYRKQLNAAAAQPELLLYKLGIDKLGSVELNLTPTRDDD